MSDLGLRMSSDRPGRSTGGGHRKGGARRKKKRRGGRRNGFAVTLALIVVVALVGGGGYFGVHYIKDKLFPPTPDYTGAGVNPITVDIPAGDTITQMGQVLQQHDVVKSVKAFTQAAADNPKSASIQPGIYSLKTEMKASLAVQALLDPANLNSNSRIVITGNERAETVLQQMSVILNVSLDSVKAAALAVPIAAPEAQGLGVPAWVVAGGATGAPAGVDPAAARLEGLLTPGTYNVETTTTAGGLLSSMVSGGLTRLQQYAPQAQALNLTAYQLLVTASIVQAEGTPAIYPKVARVILNRLAQGMPLQDDSTVLYAQSRSGTLNITTKDTQFASPYNTYQNKGLPPGPISTVDEATLQASAAPAAGNWLYFVTVNPDTGETLFTADLNTFNQGVAQLRQWQASHPTG